MNFHNIEYFLAIAEDLKISRTAERMHISQQALSEQLKKMEEELGVALVKRGQKLSLTAAGEVFRDSGRNLLQGYKEMVEKIEIISGRDKNGLTLAVPSTGTPLFVPGLLAAFQSEYPDVRVKLVKIDANAASKTADTYNLFFGTLPLGNDLENIIIKEDEYVVAVPTSLARKKYGDRWEEVSAELSESRKLQTIKELPFISLHNMQDEPVLDQKMIFTAAGFSPDIAFQSQNYELNLNMCFKGRGAYITTRDYSRRRARVNLGDEEVRIYPIETPVDPVVIAISHQKGREESKTEKIFIEFAKDYLNEQ